MADLVALLVYLHELLVYVFFSFDVLSSNINELNEQLEISLNSSLATLITAIRFIFSFNQSAFSYR